MGSRGRCSRCSKAIPRVKDHLSCCTSGPDHLAAPLSLPHSLSLQRRATISSNSSKQQPEQPCHHKQLCSQPSWPPSAPIVQTPLGTAMPQNLQRKRRAGSGTLRRSYLRHQCQPDEGLLPFRGTSSSDCSQLDGLQASMCAAISHHSSTICCRGTDSGHAHAGCEGARG